VIEREGHFVACGQLQNDPGTQELGTLVVVPAWCGRGLGSFLIKYLIQEATQPLYLECVGERRALFYTRFGFVRVFWQELPPPLKLKFGFAQVFRALFGIPGVIMQYQGLPSHLKTDC
jgi:amino-acid N-acetyltransferase